MADEALDVAVFSLSLMGKNWSEYISLVKATKTTLMQNENHFYTKKLLKIIILNSREMTCSIKAQLTDKMKVPQYQYTVGSYLQLFLVHSCKLGRPVT